MHAGYREVPEFASEFLENNEEMFLRYWQKLVEHNPKFLQNKTFWIYEIIRNTCLMITQFNLKVNPN